MFGGTLLSTLMVMKSANLMQNLLWQPDEINDDKLSKIEKIHLKDLERCQ
jgi:hypothetical protein